VDELPFGKTTWEDSWLVMPREIAAVRFSNIFTDETIGLVERGGNGALALDEVLANFPVAMLEAL
jgi:(1->4)-alpha-D-glucan 1-alpha-D-glucosylmutase